MPAPTVSLVDSSIRMKLPVARLRRYSSRKSGEDSRSDRRPISFSDRLSACSSRCRRVHVDPVAHRVDLGEHGARGVLDAVAAGRLERALRHPADHRLELARLVAGGCAGRQIMSPRDTSTSSSRRMVTDSGGNASSQRPVEGVDPGDPRLAPGGQHHHLVADPEHARGHLAGVAAVVVVLVRHRAHHPLDREARVHEVAVGRHVHVLQVVEQRGPLVPGHPLGAVHHVVAVEGRDRDEGHVATPRAWWPSR